MACEIEPDLLDLVRSLNGTRWQLFTKIQLPGSLPYVFGHEGRGDPCGRRRDRRRVSGIRPGPGYLMLQVQVTLDTPAMFMAVLLITLIGVLLYGLVLLLEYFFVPKDARVS
ncbi:MAG: hypothetical protein R3E68_08805 [Burkholderiaceae bacterium]